MTAKIALQQAKDIQRFCTLREDCKSYTLHSHDKELHEPACPFYDGKDCVICVDTIPREWKLGGKQ